MKNSNFISFEQVNLKNGFWHDRYELNRKVSLEMSAAALRTAGALTLCASTF